ncbi:helix-turn-helix domain-containing protein [Snodgrassella alvi]|uniref:helix-turn-helix domain-containing protein n=1 Tax=Snodgrassella alvi TaxID=1196083 RepID=UPI003460B266
MQLKPSTSLSNLRGLVINSQSEQILKYLQAGNALTPLEALRKFNYLRLGVRIYDLR